METERDGEKKVLSQTSALKSLFIVIVFGVYMVYGIVHHDTEMVWLVFFSGLMWLGLDKPCAKIVRKPTP